MVALEVRRTQPRDLRFGHVDGAQDSLARAVASGRSYTRTARPTPTRLLGLARNQSPAARGREEGNDDDHPDGACWAA